MFKRILTFVAAAAAAVTISSCQKDDKPTVEFEKSLYTAYAKRSVDVKVILSEPATENVSVMINSSGANAGTDFELTGVPVTIKAGETSGTFSVKNLNLTQASPLNLGIECPSGYDLGTKFVTIVAPDPEETLVYSFELTKADVLGSYVAKIKVTGVTSGDKLSLNDDVIIPLKITGELLRTWSSTRPPKPRTKPIQALTPSSRPASRQPYSSSPSRTASRTGTR